MMVFGKQNSTETVDKSNSLSSRFIPLPLTDRKPDDISSNQDTSSSTISKLFHLPSDNIPTNLISRYESTTLHQLASMNRFQTVVRLFFLKKKIFLFSFFSFNRGRQA